MTDHNSSLSIHLADEAATIALGEDLALTLRPSDWIALTGDLGAGKSTLSRALIRAMADEPELEVPSPTFTIMQSYDLRIPIAHLDLYRVSDVSELDELGLEEFLNDGILLVEWPDLAKDELPQKTRLDLTLTHEAEGRTALFYGPSALIDRLKRVRAIRSFLEAHGYGKAHRRYLSGDASPRKYELIRQDGTELVLMDWPRPLAGAIVKDGKTYAEIAHTAPDARSFVAIDRYLKAQGFTVPEIIAYDIDQGIMLLSDLGETGVLEESGAPIAERYIGSAKWLAALHKLPMQSELPVDASDIYTVPLFDPEAIKIEVSLLVEWYLPHVAGAPCPDDLKREYFAIWDDLIARLDQAEKSLLLRDFHSPNILWQNDKTGLAQVGVIDFQDAMIGPSAYDLASLVQDARVDVPQELQALMLQAYYSERQLSDEDKVLFDQSFAIMSAQRNCKLAGIWVRLMKRDGKPNYMRHMPRTFRYLNEALSAEPLKPLRDWFIKAGINLHPDKV